MKRVLMLVTNGERELKKASKRAKSKANILEKSQLEKKRLTREDHDRLTLYRLISTNCLSLIATIEAIKFNFKSLNITNDVKPVNEDMNTFFVSNVEEETGEEDEEDEK